MRVLTIGTFDVLHPGHIHLFEACNELSKEPNGAGDPFYEVIVAINTDEFVTAYKGQSPVQPYADRVTMVASTFWVDTVLPNAQRAVGDSAWPTIEASHCDVLVIGDDWGPPRDYLGQLGVTQFDLDRAGIAPVVYVPRLPGYSSTGLKGAVSENRVTNYGV